MTEACACFTTPSNRLNLEKYLGMDARYGEVSILACPDCGQRWLKLHYEDEAFTASGRWYLGAIRDDQVETVLANDGAPLLEMLNWYYCGGSYFGGQTGRSAGKVY